jgi:hypothetical protein
MFVRVLLLEAVFGLGWCALPLGRGLLLLSLFAALGRSLLDELSRLVPFASSVH